MVKKWLYVVVQLLLMIYILICVLCGFEMNNH